MGYLLVLWMSAKAAALIRRSRQSIAVLPDNSSIDAIGPGHYASTELRRVRMPSSKWKVDVPDQVIVRRSRRKALPSIYRGKGFVIAARAYPITAMVAAFSRSSLATILSRVSAAVW